MKMYEFRQLSKEEQANVTWAGVFLDVRTEDDLYILLYYVDEIFVEIYYSSATNEIVKLRPFKSSKPLQPYLDNMEMPRC